MKQFDILTNPQGDIKAVKKGWNWIAALFGMFWAFFNKLWFIGIMILLISLLASILTPLLGEGVDDLISFVIGLLIFFFCGGNGNEWLEKDLKKRGYEYKQTVSAETSEGAIALFLKENTKDEK